MLAAGRDGAGGLMFLEKHFSLPALVPAGSHFYVTDSS